MLYRPEVETLEPEQDLRLFPEEERVPTLLDYLQVVWDGRWLILAIVSATTIAALGFSLNTPKTYTAQTTLMPFGAERSGGLASALSGSLGGALGVENPGQKLVAVLESRRVAGTVVDELDLVKVLGQQTGRPPTRDEAINSVQKARLKVIGGNRGVITVRAQAAEPALAAAIANASVVAAGRFLNERSIPTNFQVLDEAVAPLQPTSPRIKLNTVVAFVFSTLAALFIVFLRQYIRRIGEERSLGVQRLSRSSGNGSTTG